ncbi:Retrovirus-related Pol polyprotein from transposon RE2 [Glycine soja]
MFMASTPSSSVPQSFPNFVAEKLDDSNYLHWRQHVKPIIKSHRLQRFVVNPIIPPRYLTEDDRVADRINPDYEAWEVQDEMLLLLLNGKTIEEYLRKIKGFVDELAGVGVPVRHEEYVDALLEGQPRIMRQWFLLSKTKSKLCPSQRLKRYSTNMKLDSCATTKKHKC